MAAARVCLMLLLFLSSSLRQITGLVEGLGVTLALQTFDPGISNTWDPLDPVSNGGSQHICTTRIIALDSQIQGDLGFFSAVGGPQGLQRTLSGTPVLSSTR